MKKYQRPFVSTIEIPERTAYACNLAGADCPHISNIVGHAICKDSGNIKIPSIGDFSLGTCA
jgi:hypothetical protein